MAEASESIGGPHGRRSAGHPWWTPVRVVLAVACIGWLLALVQKAPCAADDWPGGKTTYVKLCYSDVPFLYVGRGFAEGVLPFTDSGGRYPDLEYPVLIGYFAFGAATVTQLLHGWPDLGARSSSPAGTVYSLPGVETERQDFFVVTAVLLAPLALLTAFFLAGAHARRPWDAMAYAASPALIFTGLINWDLLAVCAVAGAFWGWSRGRSVFAGVMIGLGTAAKLYPLFLLGALLIVAIRRQRLRDFGLVVAAAAGSWLIVNLPALLTNFEAWKGFWTFNSNRGPDLGSLWLFAAHLGHSATPHTINVVSWGFFVAVCLAVLVLGLRAEFVPRIAQLAFLILVGFLLVNKVYSPQYVLWLLPIAVLARPRWRDLLIWQAGELFYFVSVWLYLGAFTASASSGGQDSLYNLAILVRVAAQLYLAAMIVRDIVRPEHDPARIQGSLNDDPMCPPVRR